MQCPFKWHDCANDIETARTVFLISDKVNEAKKEAGSVLNKLPGGLGKRIMDGKSESAVESEVNVENINPLHSELDKLYWLSGDEIGLPSSSGESMSGWPVMKAVKINPAGTTYLLHVFTLSLFFSTATPSHFTFNFTAQ